MKTKPLRLVDSDEPTRQEVALAEIDENQRKWIGINGMPWTPIQNPQLCSILDPDDVLERSAKYVAQDVPVPFWQRFLSALRRHISNHNPF